MANDDIFRAAPPSSQEVLREQVKHQKLAETNVIAITTNTSQGNGVLNIPFLVKNANVRLMDAYWGCSSKSEGRFRSAQTSRQIPPASAAGG